MQSPYYFSAPLRVVPVEFWDAGLDTRSTARRCEKAGRFRPPSHCTGGTRTTVVLRMLASSADVHMGIGGLLPVLLNFSLVAMSAADDFSLQAQGALCAQPSTKTFRALELHACQYFPATDNGCFRQVADVQCFSRLDSTRNCADSWPRSLAWTQN